MQIRALLILVHNVGIIYSIIMKILLKILIPLFVFGSIAYYFEDTIREQFFPCTAPIPYTLGTFDPRFGISRSYFLSALAEAEAIWEKPFGKELFTYKEDALGKMLKVNLVYDYRQEATSKLENLGIVVEDSRASYNNLKSKFTALKAEHATAKSTFEAKIENFNQRNLAYETEVSYWNKKGGVAKERYNELERERLALNQESRELQVEQKRLNDMVEEINALVVVLNRLVESLNLSVTKYNTVNVERGESFEEGVYVSDSSGEAIDIYEFSSRLKLVRVLAHELGHALDLDHVKDEKAIMYEFNQGDSITLSSSDLDALKMRCRVE